MAFPINQIGPYQFMRLEGIPQLPRQESIVIQRPGVTGTGFIKTGARGKQFSLRSKADVTNWAAANNANVAYNSLANSMLVDIIFGGVNYGAASIRFNVLDVEVTEFMPIKTAVGGLVAGSAIVIATWTLIAVKV